MRLWIALAGIAVLVGAGIAVGLHTHDTTTDPPVPLSTVMTTITDGHAASAVMTPSAAGSTIEISTDSGATQTAYYPAAFAETLTNTLLSHHVMTTTATPDADRSWILTVFVSVVPVVAILTVLVWFTRRGIGSSIGGFKKGRGQSLGDIPTTRFSDVAGADEAVADLNEIVAFLKDDSHLRALGASAPRGALLVGPPGTGKTLLARAVAGEAGVPFFALAGSDFVEVFAGAGARRVRDLFDRARAATHAIIFIDEIDAVGRSRGHDTADSAERDNTLLALLHEIDGFASTGVIVLAATNRADLLDSALTRPGRLERNIHVGLPDRKGREQILRVHFSGKPCERQLDLAYAARRTAGFSGADLARLANDSAIIAAAAGHDQITSADVESALATIALGRARTSALVDDADRAITAWHEAGHALVAFVHPQASNPVAVTITPRGPAGGATWTDNADRAFVSAAAASAQLVVLLAGREAEKLHLAGDFTSGAASDLKHATELATAMVTEYGMGTRLAVTGASDKAVVAEVNSMLAAAAQQAGALLASHHDALAALAAGLLDDEDLTGPQVAAIIESHPPLT